MSQNVIELVYPLNQIFIVDYSFDDTARAIDVVCLVPKDSQYAQRPVPYVTAENYVRCLSQACYLLAERVLSQGLIELDISAETFRQAATEYELYYRNLAMHFHRRVNRSDQFPMRFSLKNWKEIKRIRDFILFTFVNERTVISGEMSFVFEAS